MRPRPSHPLPAQSIDPVSFARTQASVGLDMVRGLAALVVLGGHWRNLLFVDFWQLTSGRSIMALPYLLTSAGHQAVVVFFVLSGYLVGARSSVRSTAVSGAGQSTSCIDWCGCGSFCSQGCCCACFGMR